MTYNYNSKPVGKRDKMAHLVYAGYVAVRDSIFLKRWNPYMTAIIL